MRYVFCLLHVFVLCSATQTVFADATSDCLFGCTMEKRSQDMYCPPAGGFSDDEHKLCRSRNENSFTACSRACSPTPVTAPVDPAPTAGGAPPATDEQTPVTENVIPNEQPAVKEQSTGSVQVPVQEPPPADDPIPERPNEPVAEELL